jgi:hypothetical protein
VGHFYFSLKDHVILYKKREEENSPQHHLNFPEEISTIPQEFSA